jgi:C-terminal processing protease CtpA/Prc
MTSDGLRGQPPSAPNIDQATVGKVIDAAIKNLDEQYVFPEVATKMGEALRQRQKNGEYAEIKTGPELASLLTKHLQEVSKDKHLRVRFNPDKANPTQPKGGPTPEMLARSRVMAAKSNAGFRKVERLPGNVGYIAFDFFADGDTIARPIAAAMNFLANTDALILDLRQNGGGSPNGVQVVCSYLFPAEPSIHLNSLYFRPSNRTDEFWTLKDVEGARFLVKPVYVLTSPRTFSGAEECAYNLQTRQRATIVGETTGGGAHPGGETRLADNFTMFVPRGRAINPVTNTNWEGVGVKPEVSVAADQALDTAHKLAIEKLLSGADEDTKRRINADLDRAKDRR